MTALIAVVVWLLVGYAWTHYWYNTLMGDDKRWADTGTEVGPISLIMMNLIGPVMVMLIIIFVPLEWLFTKSGPTIKKIYGG